MASKPLAAENSVSEKNGTTEIIHKSLSNLCENVTEIDVSGQKISKVDALPVNLKSLNLSNNLLNKVPNAILDLNKLLELDLSNNRIEYFDKTPAFCRTIRKLNLENNRLQKPPLWVWIREPQSLEDLNISDNTDIFTKLKQVDIDQLLKCTVPVSIIRMYNCKIYKCTELLATFKNVKELIIGVPDGNTSSKDYIEEIPCKELTEYCELQKLDLCNVKSYSINSSIGNFKLLLEVNFSYNKISSLPREFCDLLLLEICILSKNQLELLPAEFINLKNLRRLHLDYNQLYTLPDGLLSLPKLKYLDVYSNNLECISDRYTNLDELDFAQNYLNEPEDALYLSKKLKLRLEIHSHNRIDGSKPVQSPDVISDSEEEFVRQKYMCDSPLDDSHGASASCDGSSDGTDWDSESTWETSGEVDLPKRPVHPAWINYITNKMREGNFCPMDLHPESIDDILRRMPQKKYVPCEGQFDDLTDDDS